MKITVFTSNQPRHINLINSLASISDEVYVIQECNTVFPGAVEDFFRKSETMQAYFERVIESEKVIFGDLSFSPNNVKHISVRMGDLNKINIGKLKPALNSDYYIVFGSSYIKGDLIDFLVENSAINIHMGVSPYYRGNSCNFWAMYDGRPELVGATIHMLSRGLDSGDMLFHAFPPAILENDPFLLGMRAVKSAHDALAFYISNGDVKKFKPVKQDKSLQIRYTKNSEFTDEVAHEYLESLPKAEEVYSKIKVRIANDFLNPFIPSVNF